MDRARLHFNEDESDSLRVTVAEAQGWRPSMEDTHSAEVHLSAKHPTSLFAVYDGHGGDSASKFMSHHFPKEVAKLKDPLDKTALSHLLSELDAHLMKRGEQSGTTCVFAVVDQKSTGSWQITVGNVGDSRAILISADGTKELTKDHKPNNPEEQERIQAASGEVMTIMGGPPRIDGDLALSRALGDFRFKNNQSLAPEEQKVIAIPQFEEIIAKEGDILMLYCDGIVEAMGNKDVSNYVQREVKRGSSNRDVLEGLINLSIEKGSQDNHTVMMITFGARRREERGAPSSSEERETPALEQTEPSNFEHEK